MAFKIKKADRYKRITPADKLEHERRVTLQASATAQRILYYTAMIDKHINYVRLYLSEHKEIKLQEFRAICDNLVTLNKRVNIQGTLIDRRFFKRIYTHAGASKANRYEDIGDFARRLGAMYDNFLAFENLKYRAAVDELLTIYTNEDMREVLAALQMIQGYSVYAAANIGILKEYARNLRVQPECLRDFDMLLYRSVLDTAYNATVASRAFHKDVLSDEPLQQECERLLQTINYALTEPRIDPTTQKALFDQQRDYLYWFVADEIHNVMNGEPISDAFMQDVAKVMGETITIRQSVMELSFELTTDNIDDIVDYIRTKRCGVTDFVECAINRTKQIIEDNI